MNNDLLDAECVIEHLNNMEIIKMSEWHDSNPNDHDYSVYFDNPKRPGDIRIQIIKRNRVYYVPRSIINILSCRHLFNTNRIFTECFVQDTSVRFGKSKFSA